jgi:membrane-bound ClpP family serine protease
MFIEPWTLDPSLGWLLFLLGIIALIWLILTVEYTPRYSKFQIVVAIVLLSFFFGFGLQIILTSFGY